MPGGVITRPLIGDKQKRARKSPETLTTLAWPSVTLAHRADTPTFHPQNSDLCLVPQARPSLRATWGACGKKCPRQHTEGEARGSTFYRVIQAKLTNRTVKEAERGAAQTGPSPPPHYHPASLCSSEASHQAQPPREQQMTHEHGRGGQDRGGTSEPAAPWLRDLLGPLLLRSLRAGLFSSTSRCGP